MPPQSSLCITNSVILPLTCGLCVQWFVTLFARVLPAQSVHRVWDLFLLDGWKTVFRIVLAITAHLRPLIIHMVCTPVSV